MKAQRRFGLSLSWSRLTTVFLVDVVIMAVASHCPESWQGTYRIAFWVGWVWPCWLRCCRWSPTTA